MVNGDVEATFSLGRKYYLDLNSDGDKDCYVDYILLNYNENSYKQLKITGIGLYSFLSTEDEYKDFINKINSDKNFDKEIIADIKSYDILLDKNNLSFNGMNNKGIIKKLFF